MYTEPMPAQQVLSGIKQQFFEGKQASLLVTGTSMVPFLRHEKDWVLLQPVREELRVGQILLFRMGDRLMLHRLRRKKQGLYFMNGDGQTGFEVISPQQVEAVVTGVIRRSGRTLRCDGFLWILLSALWWPTRPLRPRLLRVAMALKNLVCRQK